MAVVMGLRTEDMTIDNGNGGVPEEWKKQALVEVVEPLGSETLMHVDIEGTKFIAKCEGRKTVKPDERIRLQLNLTHLHIFDAETTLSIY
jgi:multiple sugar transport system ATP-binding protein